MKTRIALLTAGFFLAALGTGFGQSTLQFFTNSAVVPDWRPAPPCLIGQALPPRRSADQRPPHGRERGLRHRRRLGDRGL